MKKDFFYFYQKSFKLKVIGFSIFVTTIIIIVYFKYTQILSQKEFFSSQTVIEDYAFIIDGDSIMISSVMIRLAGIDAPELHQFCGKKETRYPCGLEAKKYLEQLIANQPVTCYWHKKDKYRRILATCKTKKISNINAMLVRNGWAINYYDYPEEEQEARKKKKGIWQSSFQRPRAWRRAHPRTE
ncbi:thermonuclease family protein [Bartonella alsatica]|uniref:TNase-like domain-containing protein n=2 Tax=Bartonella alsatica TaxID=52764 RepID=J0YKP2_9HYPH|nr:thermonuclease family protein [Bartonella alsatica]EJF75113.1 hypothetical protein MEC_00589 [Bartonella alsatica IBS 382]QLC52494.1 thermonuclease family protein [Bartonella alsatica]